MGCEGGSDVGFVLFLALHDGYPDCKPPHAKYIKSVENHASES